MKNIVCRLRLFVSLSLLGMLSATNAWAIAAPTDTTAFLYPVYDLVYNKIGMGPTMFTVGFIGICVAGYYMFNSQWGKTLSALVATGMICGAGAIVPTLGAIF
jgi:uncharacterized integral membrane protein